MNNELTIKHIKSMIDIINFSNIDSHTEFDLQINYHNLNGFHNSTSHDLITEEIKKSLHWFNVTILKCEPKYSLNTFLFDQLFDTFIRVIFEEIFINFDKGIKEILTKIEGIEWYINSFDVVTIIEHIYISNNKLEIYKKWLKERIVLIKQKILLYVSIEESKKIVKDYSATKVIGPFNKLFNDKMPKSLKLLNSLVFKVVFSQENIDFTFFKSYLNDINTIFKTLDDDYFKLDFFLLYKMGVTEFNKITFSYQDEVENYHEKVSRLFCKEIIRNLYYHISQQKKDTESLLKVLEYLFYINIGCLFKNEKELFLKKMNEFKKKYNHIKNDAEFKKEMIGTTFDINEQFFGGYIDVVYEWQLEWYDNKFKVNKYKNKIQAIIDEMIIPSTIKVLNENNIKYDIKSLNFEFIARHINKSIWDPVILTFGENYDFLKTKKEWFDEFIYKFIYCNEMCNFWNKERKEKTIILDSFNKITFYKNLEGILGDYLDNKEIQGFNPIVLVDNNLLSPESRVTFARYEYYGDILYRILINSFKLNGTLKINNDIDYLSKDFQNLICEKIGLVDIIQSNNLSFDLVNNKFNKADYLEAFIWELYLKKGFVFVSKYFLKIFNNHLQKYLNNEELFEKCDEYLKDHPKIKYINLFSNWQKVFYLIDEQVYRVSDAEQVIYKLTRDIFYDFIKIISFENKSIFENSIHNYITLEKSVIYDYELHNIELQLGLMNEKIKDFFWINLLELFQNDFSKFEEIVNEIYESKNNK